MMQKSILSNNVFHQPDGKLLRMVFFSSCDHRPESPDHRQHQHQRAGGEKRYDTLLAALLCFAAAANVHT